MSKKKRKLKYRVIKILPYKDSTIYIRQWLFTPSIGLEIFDHVTTFNDQIYTSHILMEPEKGKKKLTKDQIHSCAEIVSGAAVASVELAIEERKREMEKLKNKKKVHENGKLNLDNPKIN